MVGAALVGGREVPPLQRPFLAIRLPEGDGELRLCELATQVKRMRRLVHVELREDLVDVRAAHELLAVEYGDRITIGEDAEVRVGDGAL